MKKSAVVSGVLLVWLGMNGLGCQALSGGNNAAKNKSDQEASVVRNPTELRLQLMRLLERARSDVVGTTADVAVGTNDLTVRDSALRYRLRATADIDRLILEPVAEEQFLQCWIMAARERLNVRTIEGGPRFGDMQEKMDQLAARMEEQIMVLGREFYSPEVLKAAVDDVEREAREGLGASAELAQRKAAKPERANDLSRIAKLPLSPFTGLQGVADTPAEIAKFTEVARGMSEMVRRLPERSRWEAELLLLQTREFPAVNKALQEISESRKSLDRAVTLAEELPGKTREELVKTLQELEKMQPELVETVKEAKATIESTEKMLAQGEKSAKAIQETSAEVEKLIARTDALAKETRAAGEAWAEVMRLVKGDEPDGSVETPDAAKGATGGQLATEDEGPDKFEQTVLMVRDARATADQVRGLLADLEKLSGKASPMAGFRQDVEAVISKAFWSAVVLLVLAFGLGVCWLGIRRKMTRLA